MKCLEEINENDQYIAIGQVATGVSPQRMNTLLGSCVALMIYHRETGTGGMAHILLPGDTNSLNSAIPAARHLIAEVRSKVPPGSRLIAKVTGGSMGAYRGDDSLIANIGGNTLISVVGVLVEEVIDIEGMHTGGEKERKVIFDLETGDVMILFGIKNESGKEIAVI